MSETERALLQRIVDCCGSPTWHAVRAIIAERDALRARLDAATDSELLERRIAGRLAQEFEARTGVRVSVVSVRDG